MNEQDDLLGRRINSFASRSFRDIADRDYIAARLACRARLMPQAMWAAQQCFEKYLKYILLVNRIPAKKVGHNIAAALQLTERLSFRLEISSESREFIDHIAEYGQYRYLDVSWFIEGPVLFNLDKATWELRRYAQILDVFGKELPTNEQGWLEEAKERLKQSSKRPPHEFRLNGGVLEEVLKSKNHPARRALIWQNRYFGNRKKESITVPDHFDFSNAPLYLYPEILEELNKFVFIPDRLQEGYREHLKEIQADPTKRP